MTSAIFVSNAFDGTWPFAADHAQARWSAQGPVRFVRQQPGDQRPASALLPPADAAATTRLLLLGVDAGADCAAAFPLLRELGITREGKHGPFAEAVQARGVAVHRHASEGYWGQSVSEFGLALTLCALRRIPQTHHQILTSLDPWHYLPADGVRRPGVRGIQFGDDARFVNGTLAGKRVSVVGAGNIGARFAAFCTALGAEVTAWDPVAPEPCFHRSGARRVLRLDELFDGCDILAPMMPLVDATRGLVTAAHLDRLRRGALVVLVTRAGIVDVPTLRRRVLADELALAADVFDVEPLPLADPLLGRHNVVHTPHNAGRTIEANRAYAEALLERFAA